MSPSAERSRHQLGDESAGRGHSYEDLWRALLLLGLDPEDELLLYQDEDATVRRADGRTEHWQMKFTGEPLSPHALKSFFQRAASALEKNPRLIYVLAHNRPLGKGAEQQLAQLSTRFEGRLRSELWQPDAASLQDRMWGRMRTMVEAAYPGRSAAALITLQQLEACLDGLIALQPGLKLFPKPVTGREVRRRIGLAHLIAELPARVAGQNILAWEAPGPDATVPVEDVTLNGAKYRIQADPEPFELDYVSELADLALDWMQNQRRSAVVLISGVSGSGKTWVLAALGDRLHQYMPVYYSDLPSREEVQLAELSRWQKTGIVLLIDRLLEDEWDLDVLSAARADPPLLVVATTAFDTRGHGGNRIDYLRRYFGSQLQIRTIGPLLSDGEKGRLIAKLRQGHVSNNERDLLASSNLRAAVALLKREHLRRDLTAPALIELWTDSAVRPWILPLLITATLHVRIPTSVHRQRARATTGASFAFPANLAPYILHRTEENDIFRWLEDPSDADAVLAYIDEEVGHDEFQAGYQAELNGLLAVVDPGSDAQRRFARQLVRALLQRQVEVAKQLVDASLETIKVIIEKEERPAFAYTWLEVLARTGQRNQWELLARTVQSLPAPQQPADVVLLVQLLGVPRAAGILHGLIRKSASWTEEPWALFLEMLHEIRGAAARVQVRRVIELLHAAPIDLFALLAMRNTAQIMLKLVRDHGRRDQREWLAAAVLKSLQSDVKVPAPWQILSQTLDLIRRRLMDPRNKLTLAVPVQLATATARGDEALQQLWGRFYENYERTRHAERKLLESTGGVKFGLSFATSLLSEPTKANELYPNLLSFVRRWGSAEDQTALRHALRDFLERFDTMNLPPRLITKTLEAAVQQLDLTSLPRDTQRLLLDFACQLDPGPQVVVMCGFARVAALHGQTAAREAAALLHDGALHGLETRVAVFEEFLIALGRQLEVEHDRWNAMSTAIQTVKSKPFFAPKVLQPAGALAANAPQEEREAFAEACYRYWITEEDWCPHHMGVMVLCLTVRSERWARRVVEPLIKRTQDPDALYRLATVEASFGDSTRAAAFFVSATRMVRQRSVGAHPQVVHHACRALSMSTSGDEGNVWTLLAALANDRLLPSAVDVLHR